MNALKAFWSVKCGLIPGDAMSEYSKAWNYTSQDFTHDGGKRGARFDEADAEASKYAAELRNGGLNWVTLEYLWL